MKKIFIISPLVLLFIIGFYFSLFEIFGAYKVLAGNMGNPTCNSEQVCSCPSNAYLDEYDDMCIGQSDISHREAINMNNVKKIVQYFDTIANTMPTLNYLSENLRTNIIGKLSIYYNQNSGINTSTVESVFPRINRDLFFRNKYVPYMAFSKSINILNKYNNLGNLIQDYIELVNTTLNYIEHSEIDMSDFSNALENNTQNLYDYTQALSSDLNVIDATISGFNLNNVDGIETSMNSFVLYNKNFQARVTSSLSLEQTAVDLATNVIDRVSKRCTDDGGQWTGTSCNCKEGFFWYEYALVCHANVSADEQACLSSRGTWNNGMCTCPNGARPDVTTKRCDIAPLHPIFDVRERVPIQQDNNERLNN
jgi:hypothetical protein